VSLDHYTTAIELVSDQPDQLFKLGDRLLRSRQVDLAISVYRRVLELDPDHRVARARLRQLRNLSRPGAP
jgi:predicted TPR repeat methyltransferase